MEPVQFRFAFTTSTALIALGVLLASSGLADWGLTTVALMLMATTGLSWWRSRAGFELGAESATSPLAARVSSQ